MAELYQQGFTLQEIGTAYSLTRERVRQILRRAKVPASKGGAAVRARRTAAQKAAAALARKDARCMATYGCTHAQFVKCNHGAKRWDKGSRSRAYLNQRRNAKSRSIPWEISFPEWCRLWDESGHWGERGLGRDLYVMARKQDFGPYAPWNVYITTSAQNVSDYQAELKRRGVKCADGYVRLPERVALLEAA